MWNCRSAGGSPAVRALARASNISTMDPSNAKPRISIPARLRSRGYLPHCDVGEEWQFITLHLGDALPIKVIDRWKSELAGLDDEVAEAILFRRTERYIDQGYGSCALRKPEIGEVVQEALLHHHLSRYELHSWVIMPNHTHFLILPLMDLSDVMQKHKSYTAHECNRSLGQEGRFWQEDYYDRLIRDRKHFAAVLNYIENNPVKARLCKKPEEWKLSSAYYRANFEGGE
jgi:REP element-mobilizing transposase RayT